MMGKLETSYFVGSGEMERRNNNNFVKIKGAQGNINNMLFEISPNNNNNNIKIKTKTNLLDSFTS